MNGALARVSVCTSPKCAMRFPCPPGDARVGTCPRCEHPTADLGPYYPPFDHPAEAPNRVELCGILDNIRSALNVGTMLRAADGACLAHMHLCGLTPGADHPKVAKTGLGAEFQVPWTQHLDATACVQALLDHGWVVWAVESTLRSVPIADAVAELPDRLALIVGNEIAGVDPGLLDMAAAHLHLPMGGTKTTLNVGVAFGAAIYGIRTAERSLHRSG